MKYSVGIDLGGTKVESGLFNSKGQRLASTRQELHEIYSREDSVKNQQKRLCQAICKQIISLQSQLSRHDVCIGWGLASAGPVDVLRRELVNPANFPGWKRWSIARQLEQTWRQMSRESIAIRFQNDAMAAALGEAWVGQAQGTHTSLAITLGTGVGTGVILNGQPAQTQGCGAEWGHMLIASLCGSSARPRPLRHLSVEAFASGTGMKRRAQELGLDRIGCMGCKSPADIFAMRKSTKHSAKQVRNAQEITDDLSRALASLLFNLSLGFAPEVITLSGGLLQARGEFLSSSLKLYRSWIREFGSQFLAKVYVSRLENAVLVGAGSLPWRLKKSESQAKPSH